MQLFVNTPGTLIKQKDACFRLSHKEKFFDVSPEKVESIVTTNKAMISTQAIVLALENNINIIFLIRLTNSDFLKFEAPLLSEENNWNHGERNNFGLLIKNKML